MNDNAESTGKGVWSRRSLLWFLPTVLLLLYIGFYWVLVQWRGFTADKSGEKYWSLVSTIGTWKNSPPAGYTIIAAEQDADGNWPRVMYFDSGHISQRALFWAWYPLLYLDARSRHTSSLLGP